MNYPTWTRSKRLVKPLAFLLIVLGAAALACNLPLTKQSQEVPLEVSVEPAVVEVQGDFRITVTLSNPGSQPITISEIALPRTILEGTLVNSISPQSSGQSELGSATAYQFDLSIPPGGSSQFVFDLTALEEGDFSGNISVIAGEDYLSAQVRVVVQPGETVVSQPATETPYPLGSVPFQAVVQIIAMYEEGGELYQGWTGSGSIITPDGLILTNAHVVLPDKYYPVDALVVALTESADKPPTPRYYAEVMQADPDLDIAVIKVTADLDGNPVNPAALNLPTVPIGNSDELALGDAITILGGGETITLTRGEVSGFTSEADYGERAFIKTSATIAGGNSGGLAANARGELIGIPTQLGYGGEDQFVDCRVLADTNRDGVIDDRDSCIPTGGFINALRPINLALPLAEAAKRGEVWVGEVAHETLSVPAEGETLFTDDFSDPNSGWNVWQGESGGTRYVQGEYQIEVNKEKYLIWGALTQDFGDIVVSVDARVVKATGEGDFGVICGYVDENNFYALEVSEDGFFAIWKFENGEYVPIVEWEYSEAIPREGEPIMLTAVCAGNTLGLAVNGALLSETTEASFRSAGVGLIAGTWNQSGVIVSFDNFIVLRAEGAQ
jgi:S1-C subfamily serine protease